MRAAIILDFDGLVIDTEWPDFAAWRELATEFGASMTEQIWLQAVGLINAFNPRAWLEQQTGKTLDWAHFDQVLSARRQAFRDLEGPLPGVAELLERAAGEKIPVGVASNSDTAWVTAGLQKLGFLDHVQTIRGRDRVEFSKPHPAPYLAALADLGADAGCSVAFEDSRPGVEAARAAGLTVYAVPNRLTRFQDLSLAHGILNSIADFDFDAWRREKCAS